MYQFDELEKGLEFLNHVIAKRDTLLEVYLLEDGQRTTLSVASFDGLSFLRTLRQMESEWKYRLSNSLQIQRQVYQDESHWYRKKLSYYEQRIAHLELMVDEVTSHCQPENNPRISQNQIIVARYRSLLGRYQIQLGQSHFIRNIILDRLYNPKFDIEV